MTNVLWLASWYPSRLDWFTGDFIERHAKAVSKYLKITVLVILKDEALNFDEVDIEKTEEGNLTVYRVFYGKTNTPVMMESFLSVRKYFSLQKRLFKQIEKEIGRPDMVHVHVAMKAGMLAIYLKKKFRIPFVVTEHWTGYYPQSKPNIYDSNFIYKSINKLVLQNAGLFLPVSKHLGETVNKFFARVKYEAVPNAVDTNLFFYETALTVPKFRFIHPSVLNYQKNAEGILLACLQLKNKGYDFELLMIGKEDNKLTAFAAENNLLNKNVFFKGAVSYADVAHEMQRSSALLLFSRFENLPCVVLEALCCGLPVISSNVGGVAEVVNEKNGVLVASEDVDQLANAMQSMIDNFQDYDKESIAELAFQAFNYDKVGSQYVAIYKTMISNNETTS